MKLAFARCLSAHRRFNVVQPLASFGIELYLSAKVRQSAGCGSCEQHTRRLCLLMTFELCHRNLTMDGEMPMRVPYALRMLLSISIISASAPSRAWTP